MLKFRLRGQSLLLLLLLSLITILYIGDFKVRLANTDEYYNSVDIAYFLQNPARFKYDMITTYGYLYGLSSILYWLPAVLLKAINLPPEILTWLFVYMQNVLLGFALLYYTRVVAGRRDIAWVTIFFAYAAQPWRWNLANYESIMYFPYPGQLVFPFLIFAAAEVIQGHVFKVACLLVLSGLIHSSLTFQMVVIVTGFWLLQYGFREPKNLLRRILSLGVVIMVCLVPVLILRFKYPDQISVSELMSLVRHAYHMNPPIFPPFWAYRLPTFFGFMGLTVLALRCYKGFNASFIKFWFACLGASILLAFVHIAGLIWGIPRLLQLSPLRSTILVIMFSLPLVIAYLIEKIESDRFMTRWIAASLLFLHAFFSFGVFWGLILALAFSDLSEGHLSIIRLNLRTPIATWFRRASSIIFIGWLGLVLIWGAYAVLGGPNVSSRPALSILIPGVLIDAQGFLFAIIAALGVGLSGISSPDSICRVLRPLVQIFRFLSGIIMGMEQSIKMKLQYSITKFALIAMLISLTMFKAYKCGTETAQPLAKANYAAQAWARYNTAQDAVFIVLLRSGEGGIPWRSVSLRSAIFPFRLSKDYIYTGSRLAKKINDEMELFLSQDIGYKYKKKLDEAGILRWAKRFGGNYVITSVSEPLKFPEAYRNDYIIIYKLPLS